MQIDLPIDLRINRHDDETNVLFGRGRNWFDEAVRGGLSALIGGTSAPAFRRNRVRAAAFALTLVTSILGASAVAWSAEDHGQHIMIRPDELKWTAAPKSFPASAQIVLIEGDPAKAVPLTMRLKFPAGYKIRPHTHPVIEHVTVLSGTFHMGAGDMFDEATAKRLPAGSFVVMPANTPHYAWASEETVIQLHSVGPWGITYVNEADDPRRSR